MNIDNTHPTEQALLKEYTFLVTENWEQINMESAHQHPKPTLLDCLANPNRLPSPLVTLNQDIGTQIELLVNLITGRHWDAVNLWANIGTLSHEKRDMYARYMIAQALQPESSIKYPYCWLVEHYDNGNFCGYIAPENFHEYVNRGFWEYAQEYFINPVYSGLVAPGDILQCLLRHFDQMDFARYQQLGCAITMWDTRSWVTGVYIDRIRAMEEYVPTEYYAHLIHPIIDRAIRGTFNAYEWVETEVARERILVAFAPYKQYISLAPIQKLFKYYIRSWIGLIDYCDYNIRSGLTILSDFVVWGIDEQKQFYSNSLPTAREYSKEWVTRLVEHHGLPAKWFCIHTITTVNAQIANYVRNPIGYYAKSIVPYIELLNSAYELGWIMGDEIMQAVNAKVSQYLALKRVPAGDKLIPLQKLNPALLDPSVYPHFTKKAIKDLRTRKQNELADTWGKSITPPA